MIYQIGGKLHSACDHRSAGSSGNDHDQTLIAVADSGSVAEAQGLVVAAGGISGEDLHHQVAGQRIHYHNVRRTHKKVVAAHYDAAVGSCRLGKADIIALLLQLKESLFRLSRAVDIGDANGGMLHAVGLSRDDSINCVLYHSADTVRIGGACGGGNVHGLTNSGGDHLTYGGNADGEGIMHGNGGGDLAGIQHYFHLFVNILTLDQNRL